MRALHGRLAVSAFPLDYDPSANSKGFLTAWTGQLFENAQA